MPDRFLRYWATTRVGQVASHLFNDLFENDENRSEEEYYESISRVPGGSKRIHRKRVELENDCIAQIFTRIGTETNQIKNAMVFFNALGISDQVSDATNNGQNQAAAFSKTTLRSTLTYTFIFQHKALITKSLCKTRFALAIAVRMLLAKWRASITNLILLTKTNWFFTANVAARILPPRPLQSFTAAEGGMCIVSHRILFPAFLKLRFLHHW